MSTEMTDKMKIGGWVLYDAQCSWCVRLARWAQPSLARRNFTLVPLQADWVRRRLNLPDQDLLAEMRLLTPDGNCVGGADALLKISEQFWWCWPMRRLADLNPVKHFLRRTYQWVARNRPCAAGGCKLAPEPTPARVRPMDLLPLIALTLTALLARPHLTDWAFMWAIALALFGGCKWITYRNALQRAPMPAFSRVLGYFLAWPGMNAAAFLSNRYQPSPPQRREWILAITKTTAGTFLVWGVAPYLFANEPMLACWIAMTGLVLMLHFGTFELLSLLWRRGGVWADPIMHKPLEATSLADFWSRRWNTAFSELASQLAFRPLRRRTSIATATLLTFGTSGLVHELVISLPAHGGYGLPTAYFLLQGLGILLERSAIGKSLGFGHGLRGRIFVAVVTCGPVVMLFPPPFIQHVILPMLSAMGAT